MRAALWALGLLAAAGPARAGVYNLAEQPPGPVPFTEARNFILKLRSAGEAPPGVPAPDSFRAQALRLAARFERDRREGPFATLDRVTLSGCYLRLGRLDDALKLLREEKSDHFLILAHLASAYFLSGDIHMACRTQQRVLEFWPPVWAGWTEPRRLFYRDCERHLLRLFEARRAEAVERKGTGFGVDPIFPGLRFIGPDGRYEAGGLAPTMRDRVPADGFNVVFELCSWYPGDRRLYWLLAESLNALGHVGPAGEILAELVNDGHSDRFVDLAAHRRTLLGAVPAFRELQDPAKRGLLLAELLAIPGPTGGPPVIGDAAYAAASGVAIQAVPLFSKQLIDLGPGTGPTADPPAPELPFNWRHVTVGFATGFLVAALVGFQVQELRRRRSAPPPG